METVGDLLRRQDAVHCGSEPGMLEGHFCCGTSSRIESKHGGYQIFGFFGDVIPMWRGKSELAEEHLRFDLRLGLTSERRDTACVESTEEDVEDHTAAPDIALLSVFAS